MNSLTQNSIAAFLSLYLGTDLRASNVQKFSVKREHVVVELTDYDDGFQMTPRICVRLEHLTSPNSLKIAKKSFLNIKIHQLPQKIERHETDLAFWYQELQLLENQRDLL